MAQQQRQQAAAVNVQTRADDVDMDDKGTICRSNYIANTLFDALNFDRHGKYTVNGAPLCFFSTTNCGGDVYNGRCENHWGLQNLKFKAVSSPIYPNAIIMPVSTKTHNRPVKLMPLLSMLGRDGDPISLVHDDSAIQSESEFMINMAINSSSDYQTPIANKLHAFKQQYNGYIQSKLSDIAQRMVAVNFTPRYAEEKKSPFAEKLYKMALEGAAKTGSNTKVETICILVPLKLFENIFDVLNILAHWPGQFALSDRTDDVVSIVPNVYIIDGWFMGGCGFGTAAYTGDIPLKKLGNFESHTIDKQTKDKLMRGIVPVINPVVLDYKAPPPGSMFVIRPTVSAVSTVHVDRDIMPESYSNSISNTCNNNYSSWV